MNDQHSMQYGSQLLLVLLADLSTHSGACICAVSSTVPGAVFAKARRKIQEIRSRKSEQNTQERLSIIPNRNLNRLSVINPTHPADPQ